MALRQPDQPRHEILPRLPRAPGGTPASRHPRRCQPRYEPARGAGVGQIEGAMRMELTPRERAWYIKAAGQFGWSKLELAGNIRERIHEGTARDNTADPCYSNGSEGDEDGEEETSRAFLQGLRDAEAQRELQRQGVPDPVLELLSALAELFE